MFFERRWAILTGPVLIVFALCGAAYAGQSNNLAVSDRGIGRISDQTPFTPQAIARALPGFSVREEKMEGEGGLYKMIIASREGIESIRFYGYGTVVRADDSDPDIPVANGATIGASFSDVYADKSEIACEPGMEAFAGDIVCLAPDLNNVALILSGRWHGPDGDLPPRSVLSSWKVTTIIWNAPF